MRKLHVIGLALSVVVMLSGCVPPQPSATPTSLPSTTQAFASDEEALAAAKVAYGEYQAAIDRALTDYDTSGLDKVATGDALAAAKESVAIFKSKNRKLTGRSSIDTLSIAQAPSPGTPFEMQIYACLDLSGTDVVDATGHSVIETTRQTRVPMAVSLLSSSGPAALLVMIADVWDGDDFC